MTTKRPWYPFYVADYRADTVRLTLEEHGIYLLLMNEYWHSGGLPADEVQLARIVGLSVEEWRCKCIRPASYFASDWRHKRIDAELKKCGNIRQQRQEAAGKRWKNKGKKKDANAYANASAPHMLPHTTLHTSNGRDSSYLIDPTRLNHLPVSEKRAKAKPVRKRQEYPDDFEAFWRAYPTDANMAKAEAFAEWKKIGGEDREIAIRSLPGFQAYCASRKDYRPIHANRYLKFRRFEGHAETAAKTSELVFVAKDSPEGRAWWEHRLRTTGKYPPVDKNGGWRFSSRWPPETEGEMRQ